MTSHAIQGGFTVSIHTISKTALALVVALVAAGCAQHAPDQAQAAQQPARIKVRTASKSATAGGLTVPQPPSGTADPHDRHLALGYQCSACHPCGAAIGAFQGTLPSGATVTGSATPSSGATPASCSVSCHANQAISWAPVGGDGLACSSCHDVAPSGSVSAHPVDLSSAAANRSACQSCHDVSAHAAGSVKLSGSGAIDDLCQGCHAGSGSTLAGVSPPLLVGWNDAAGDFHGSRKGTGFGGTLAAPYARGQAPIACTACHQPHSSKNPFLFTATANGTPIPAGSVTRAGEGGEQLCASCHQGERHAGCTACHASDPAAAGAACLSCHGHEGVRLWPQPGSSMAGSMQQASCQHCHSTWLPANPDVAPSIANLAAIGVSQAGGTISWDTNVPATSFVAFGSPSVAQVTGDPTLVRHHEVALSGLDAGKVYAFQVTSADVYRNQVTSPASSFTTVASNAPAAPSLAQLAPITQPHPSGEASLPATATLAWTVAAGLQYEAQVAYAPTFLPDQLVATLPLQAEGTAPVPVQTLLSTQTTYWWRVRASDGSTSSPWSNGSFWTYGDDPTMSALLLDVAVDVVGAGQGTVTSAPADVPAIACGNGQVDCAGQARHLTSLTLTATPADASSIFKGWSGCDTSVGPVCTVTVFSARQVLATFEPATFPLAIAYAGYGAGSVAADAPVTLSCGAGGCSATVANGASVTLKAAADASSSFKGWGAGCAGTGDCTLVMNGSKNVVATFAPTTLRLAVTVTGSGTVTSAPVGLTCSAGTCPGAFAPGTKVVLTAAAADGQVFKGWTGPCGGTGACTVTLNAAASVLATFQPATVPLTVVVDGAGQGTVTGGGLTCATGSCVQAEANGSTVQLTAAPADAGSTFAGWSGCGSFSSTTCNVAMTEARTVRATFAPSRFPLTLTYAGTASGTVGGLAWDSCTASGCTALVTAGSSLTLAATAASGAVFKGWGVSCSGTGSCGVEMKGPRTVVATFVPATYGLTVTMAGDGVGAVTGSGLGCATGNPGSICTVQVAPGTSVTLTANPTTSPEFKGWSVAGCGSSASCTFTVNATTGVTATFGASNYELSVEMFGAGQGTVSDGGTLSCKSDPTDPTSVCTSDEVNGSIVTLTATPTDPAQSVFRMWSGCSSSNAASCTVAMTSARTVAATFELATYPVTLSYSGTGAGTVAGLTWDSCDAAGCVATVTYGTPVTLTAQPNGTSLFQGWGNVCTGTGTCSFTVNGPKTALATFNPASYQLSVTVGGPGTGSVSGPGLSCATGSSANCSTSVANGESITLTATPATGQLFTGWAGGGCSGTVNTCIVTMSSARSVTASFSPPTFPLTVTVAGAGTGTVSGPGIPSSIACTTGSTAGCSAGEAKNTLVALTATPAAGSIFKSWSGCTSVSGPTCNVYVTAAKSVTATFEPATFPLNLTFGGLGKGTVSGVTWSSCTNAGCTASVANGASVSLSAAANAGSTFKGWGILCSGTGVCAFKMNSAKTVQATFSSP